MTLALRRSRSSPIKRLIAARRARIGAKTARLDRVFGVQCQQQAQPGTRLHRFDQAELVEEWVFGQAAVTQESLDADHAIPPQLGDVVERLGNDAAPQGIVDHCVVGDGAALQGQGARVEGWRVAVQRHVADGRDAARRGRRCAAQEALPLGAPRLIEVHVCVDHARQDVQAGRVERVVSSAGVVGAQDRNHPPLLDQQICSSHGQLVDQLSARHEQGRHSASTFSREVSTRSTLRCSASAPSRPTRQVCRAISVMCMP